MGNVYASETHKTESIQPRIFVEDVLSFYDTYTYWVGTVKNSYDYNHTYTTIQYLHSYTRTSKVTDISSIGDKLSGNIRTRTTYTYKTN